MGPCTVRARDPGSQQVCRQGGGVAAAAVAPRSPVEEGSKHVEWWCCLRDSGQESRGLSWGPGLLSFSDCGACCTVTICTLIPRPRGPTPCSQQGWFVTQPRGLAQSEGHWRAL